MIDRDTAGIEDRRVRQESAAAVFAELFSSQLNADVSTARQWLSSSQLSGHPGACLLDIDAEKALDTYTQTQSNLSKPLLYGKEHWRSILKEEV